MNDEAIRQLVADIDAMQFDGEPRSQITSGKPDVYLAVTANQSGLVLLARMLLQAALSPANDEQQHAAVTCVHGRLHQIFGMKGDRVLGPIMRSEEIPVPDEINAKRKRVAKKQDRFFLAGMVVAGFLRLTLVVSGLIFWIVVFSGDPTRDR